MSDLLDTSAAREPEFMAWCSAAIETWKESGPCGLEREFVSLVFYFDWSFEVSEQLIRSAYPKINPKEGH